MGRGTVIPRQDQEIIESCRPRNPADCRARLLRRRSRTCARLLCCRPGQSTRSAGCRLWLPARLCPQLPLSPPRVGHCPAWWHPRPGRWFPGLPARRRRRWTWWLPTTRQTLASPSPSHRVHHPKPSLGSRQQHMAEKKKKQNRHVAIFLIRS